MVSRAAFAAALLVSTTALAQTANHPMTGAGDTPKTTTSATESKTTDAAGLGAPVPGTTDAANVPMKPKSAPRHRHHAAPTVPSAPH